MQNSLFSIWEQQLAGRTVMRSQEATGFLRSVLSEIQFVCCGGDTLAKQHVIRHQN